MSPEQPLASIGQRIGARLIDGLLVGVPFFLIALTYVDIDAEEVSFPLALTLGAFVVGAVYEIGLTMYRGQTVGKMVVGIRVGMAEGGRVTPTAAAVRYLLPTAVGAIPIPGAVIASLVIYARAIWAPRRQGWHDAAAGTIVVRAR